MKIALLLLSLAFIAHAADVNERYTTALDLMKQGSRADALQEFRALASSNPNHQLCGNFHYWAGEALLGLGRTQEATVEYTLATTVKNTNKEKDARFMLGHCFMKLGNTERAKAEWQRFLRDYPDDELAPKIKKRIGE